MKITADLHTHTVFSHGKGTVAESCEAAIARGLTRIAITDHDETHLLYGVKRGYFEAIDAARQVYAGRLEILTGIEANLTSLDGISGAGRERLSRYDIVILGYHKLVKYDSAAAFWHFSVRNTLAHDAAATVERTTAAYIAALNTARIDVLAHPQYGILADWQAIAWECVKTGTAIELNDRNLNLTTEEIAALKETGVKFAVNSDAHDPGRIGAFANAIEAARAAGLCAGDIINAEEQPCHTARSFDRR